MLNLNLLDYFSIVFNLSKIHQKNVIWCCANIACSSIKYVKTLIGHPIFEMIMKKIDLVEETILKEEIAWFLGNIISLFDFELTFKVINFDVLNFLMKLLNSNLSFPSLVISLRDIHNIFVTEILFKTKQENNSDSNIDSINYL